MYVLPTSKVDQLHAHFALPQIVDGVMIYTLLHNPMADIFELRAKATTSNYSMIHASLSFTVASIEDEQWWTQANYMKQLLVAQIKSKVSYVTSQIPQNVALTVESP